MIQKILLLTIFCISTLLITHAQPRFISKGKIEFEKQENLHKQLDANWGDDEDDDVWKATMKKSLPKFQTTYYNLLFNEDKTLYKAGRETPATAQKVPEWMSDPSYDNIVYNDLKQQQTSSYKSVFETKYLLQDSIKNIDWRITSDTRDIAGFECRKAIGKVMDSIYVIAYYTDQITVSGGPNGFVGLPGMVLGVAIPRLNTTWFATKLELVDVKESDLTQPIKGKKTNYKDLMQQLKKSTKDWGKYGQRNIWMIMI